MWRILRIEFRKNKQYRAFWVMFGLYFLVLSLTCFGLIPFLSSIGFAGQSGLDFSVLPIYHFPDIWQNICFVANLWPIKTLPAILVIVLISNEYSYKTIRQSIINGQSRSEFFWAKYSNVILISLISTLLVAIAGIILGYIYTPKIKDDTVLLHANFLVGYFIELICYLSSAFFFAILIQRSGLTILIFLAYALIEVIIVTSSDTLTGILPMSVMRELIPSPFQKYLGQALAQGLMEVQSDLSWWSVLKGISYSFLFSGASWWVIRKKDL